MGTRRRRRTLEDLVATYADPEGRRHRIVLWGRLVLDLCARRAAVVVAELSKEEGIDQAKAAVFGGEFDQGYLARAQSGQRSLGRRLSATDLKSANRAEQDESTDGDQRVDQGRRLAA